MPKSEDVDLQPQDSAAPHLEGDDDAGHEASAPSYITLSIIHRQKPYQFTLPAHSNLADLATRIEEDLSLPVTRQTFMITPGIGILKPPFTRSNPRIATLKSCKITLLAPTSAEVNALQGNGQARSSSSATKMHRPIPTATPAITRHRDSKKIQDEATYTFHNIVPLSYLPDPSRSQQFLERLRDDPGIRRVMCKHRFSVGTLTEMDPLEHTTHDSKTLGLNRNKGQVIELRLRTDTFDGYRHYHIIRDTLCHELAHCVHEQHDRKFWDLTKQIEQEVRRNDWKSGGQALTSEIYYTPDDAESGSGKDPDGHTGLTGGDFVLGRSEVGVIGRSASSNDHTHDHDGHDAHDAKQRRDILAKAAEERIKKLSSKPG